MATIRLSSETKLNKVVKAHTIRRCPTNFGIDSIKMKKKKVQAKDKAITPV